MLQYFVQSQRPKVGVVGLCLGWKTLVLTQTDETTQSTYLKCWLATMPESTLPSS